MNRSYPSRDNPLMSPEQQAVEDEIQAIRARIDALEQDLWYQINSGGTFDTPLVSATEWIEVAKDGMRHVYNYYMKAMPFEETRQ